MIPQGRANEIRRLLASGTHSLRGIARATGTSRGTVAAIAHGRWRERPPGPPDANAEETLGPIERCPECGVLVHAPCRACRARRVRRIGMRDPPSRSGERPLRVELSGEYRRRYEEVRARRMREGCEDP